MMTKRLGALFILRRYTPEHLLIGRFPERLLNTPTMAF
jgi:hypothetical protein